ncbi:MAG: hypothetical protein ABFD07_20370 [Methanobacterium sp.]
MVINSFIDPITKNILAKDDKGDLFHNNQKYIYYDGIYNFIPETIVRWQEKEYHEKIYKKIKSAIITQ